MQRLKKTLEKHSIRIHFKLGLGTVNDCIQLTNTCPTTKAAVH